MNGTDPFEDMQRAMDELFKIPGRDAERLNRALGEGMALLDPEHVRDRIEAALDSLAGREVLDMPRVIGVSRPVFMDGIWKRR